MITNNIWWIIGIIAAVWVIYDVVTNQKSMSNGKKVVWIILAIPFSIITAIAYYLINKR